MAVSQTPPDNLVYTSSVLTLRCTIIIHEAVDTEIEVDSSFSGPGGVLPANNQTNISDTIGSKLIYRKTAVLSFLQSSDTGIYHCITTVRPKVQSGLIVASNQGVVDVNITVGKYDDTLYSSSACYKCYLFPFTALYVSIVIHYTPTSDVYFGPPNYRPGASVTLTCNVFGATKPIRYRWSSTSPCSENGCFASSSTSSSVSTSTLYWYDAGQHTCTAFDADGNYGSATIEMNIIGVIHNLLMAMLIPLPAV